MPLLTSPDEIGLALIRRQYLGHFNGDKGVIDCYCGEIADGIELPPGMIIENLRPRQPVRLYFERDQQILYTDLVFQ